MFSVFGALFIRNIQIKFHDLTKMKHIFLPVTLVLCLSSVHIVLVHMSDGPDKHHGDSQQYKHEHDDLDQTNTDIDEQDTVILTPVVLKGPDFPEEEQDETSVEENTPKSDENKLKVHNFENLEIDDKSLEYQEKVSDKLQNVKESDDQIVEAESRDKTEQMIPSSEPESKTPTISLKTQNGKQGKEETVNHPNDISSNNPTKALSETSDELQGNNDQELKTVHSGLVEHVDHKMPEPISSQTHDHLTSDKSLKQDDSIGLDDSAKNIEADVESLRTDSASDHEQSKLWDSSIQHDQALATQFEASLTGEQGLPIIHDAPPTKEQTMPAIQEAPHTGEQALPTRHEAPHTGEQAPPTNYEVPPTEAGQAKEDDHPESVDHLEQVKLSDQKEGTQLEPPTIETEQNMIDKVPETETKTPVKGDHDDDLQVPEAVDDHLPSFDEWKRKMLSEQASQEKTKNHEAVQSTQQLSTTPPNNKKGSKKVNYASATCGAKIRVTNSEAQNPGFILTENKDQYMINPCKAKKWFTVELCTPVQIQSIEIGNLELFSSLPESFVVQVSEGYPTKDWKPLGTFHARDLRAVQSFTVDNDQIYAHYMRVEMLSHYGHEHYCPLTVLRVFGLTVIEADEEAEDEEQNPEDVDDIPIEQTEGKETTLFSSATDTVISLVKTVLHRDDKQTDETSDDIDDGHRIDDTLTETNLSDVVNLEANVLNTTAKNSTRNVTETSMEPCVPNVSSESVPSAPSDSSRPAEPRTPQARVDKLENNEGKSVGDYNLEPPSVRVPNKETLTKMPVVQLSDLLVGCFYCTNDLRPSCYSDRQSICGYYRLCRFIPPSCCVDINRTVDHVPVLSPVVTPKRDNGKVEALVSKEFDIQPSQIEVNVDSLKIIHTPVLDDQSKSNIIEASFVDPTKTLEILESSQINVAPVASKEIRGTVCSDPDKSEDAGCHVPEVKQIRPSSPMVEDKVIPPMEQEEILNSNAVRTLSEMPIPDGVVVEEDSKPKMKDIYAEDPTNFDPDWDFDHPAVPPGDDIQYQKLISGKKETTFMRLKNRIKSLELNLSLSSQYLEQLSQQYKKRMEDMYVSLNKTITKLANTSRRAEERDLKQQEHIAVLLNQIDQLNSSIKSLHSNLSDIHMQVIERHLYLMMIEAAVFLLVLAWCLNRQEKNIRNFSEARKAQQTPVRVPSGENAGARRRRNSADDTPNRPRTAPLSPRRSHDDCYIKHLELSDSFSTVLPTNLGFVDDVSQWENKKKKKKRMSNAQKSLSFGHLVGTTPDKSRLDNLHTTNQNSVNGHLHMNGSNLSKKRHSLGSGLKTNGGELSSNGHRHKGSDGAGKIQLSDHATKSNLRHKKQTSYDKSYYGSLASKCDNVCNGHFEDLSASARGQHRCEQIDNG